MSVASFEDSLQTLADRAMNINRYIPLLNALMVEFDAELTNAREDHEAGDTNAARMCRARARAFLKAAEIAASHQA